MMFCVKYTDSEVNNKAVACVIQESKAKQSKIG